MIKFKINKFLQTLIIKTILILNVLYRKYFFIYKGYNSKCVTLAEDITISSKPLRTTQVHFVGDYKVNLFLMIDRIILTYSTHSRITRKPYFFWLCYFWNKKTTLRYNRIDPHGGLCITFYSQSYFVNNT